MFGLFDNFDPEDPRKLGLLMAGLAALQGAPNSRKNLGADLAHAGLMGLQGYSQATSMKDKRAEEKQQRELRQMQLEQARMGLQDEQAYRGALGAMPNFAAPTAPDMAPTPENLAQLKKPSRVEELESRIAYLRGK
ncbi:MAG TPA: hypothetical protein VEI97_04540, partial [bacterium]|nr:hypothetical protein [bacterium]